MSWFILTVVYIISEKECKKNITETYTTLLVRITNPPFSFCHQSVFVHLAQYKANKSSQCIGLNDFKLIKFKINVWNKCLSCIYGLKKYFKWLVIRNNYISNKLDEWCLHNHTTSCGRSNVEPVHIYLILSCHCCSKVQYFLSDWFKCKHRQLFDMAECRLHDGDTVVISKSQSRFIWLLVGTLLALTFNSNVCILG